MTEYRVTMCISLTCNVLLVSITVVLLECQILLTISADRACAHTCTYIMVCDVVEVHCYMLRK